MEAIRQKYRRSKNTKIFVIISSLVLLICAAFYFSSLGVTNTNLLDVADALFRWITYGPDNASKQDKIILLLRCSRVIMSVLAGYGLAISGTAMQAVTRNSMVSPFTIGISNAAALGASLSIVFSFGIMGGSSIGTVVNAFLWAVMCMTLVYLLTLKISMSPTAIVLTGIALNYFFGACTSTIKYFASEYNLSQVVDWEFGSVNGIDWDQVAVVLPFVAICGLIIFLYSPALNIIASGDDEVAASLGVKPQRVRITIMLLSALVTAAIISFTGVIGFVGLVAPHIARLIIGSDHRFLIPFSGIVGAFLTLVADTVGRLILAPVVIPVGIVISYIGVPIFIYLIIIQKRGRL